MKILLLIFTLLISFDAFACKCDEFNVSGYVKLSDKAYIGELLNFSEFGNKGLVSASLKVTESFVGQMYDIEEAIITTKNVCGLTLKEGEKYIVFETQSGLVNFCTMQNMKDVQNLEWNLQVLRDLREKGI